MIGYTRRDFVSRWRLEFWLNWVEFFVAFFFILRSLWICIISSYGRRRILRESEWVGFEVGGFFKLGILGICFFNLVSGLVFILRGRLEK